MSKDQPNFTQGETAAQATALMVLIGFCGQKAAGKDIAAEHLVAHHGFRAMGFGDVVRKAAREEYGLERPTVGNLIRIGNEGRHKSGDNGYWAGKLVRMIEEQGVMRAVVQGIRNPGEIDRLYRELGYRFFLFGITAPLRLRSKRLMSRGRSGDPETVEDFMDLDDADRGIGQPADGQRTDDCLARVDLANRFVNTGSLDDYRAWLDERIAAVMRALSNR